MTKWVACFFIGLVCLCAVFLLVVWVISKTQDSSFVQSLTALFGNGDGNIFKRGTEALLNF